MVEYVGPPLKKMEGCRKMEAYNRNGGLHCDFWVLNHGFEVEDSGGQP